ncbi:MAG: HPr family phosphocarrier protein, partial [Akkermansiaceae bacterium]|nr:HPr family phosphocarrier protein [Akkermansiaceae bacterium]
GIAARSDEHLEVLANLTRVLGDEELIYQLSETNDRQDIITELVRSRKKVAPATKGKSLAEFTEAVEVTISGGHGLHARPATAFVDTAKQFSADIRVGFNGKVADGKSLVALLQLGVEGGKKIRISAEGPDADKALKALETAVKAGLGDEEEEAPEAAAPSPVLAWNPEAVGLTIPGLSASPGLAVGNIRHYVHRKIVVEATAKDPAAEAKALNQAIATAQVELDQLYEEVKERSGAGRAAIFRAHAEFLNDPELIEETIGIINEGHSAGWAWQKAIEERVASMKAVGDKLIAARAADLGDVGHRVLKLIAGVVDDEPFIPDEPVILIAEDLTPSDTASLDPNYILGFCTASGGPTSHTAIIARSLGIPAI